VVLRRLAKSLISIVFTLLALEAWVRWTDADVERMGDPFRNGPVLFRVFVPDAFLQWRNRPGMFISWAGVRLNARGQRGSGVPPRKRPGVLRIVVLGDSCSFGILATGPGNFEMPKPYAEALQALLDRDAGPGRFEVINYGTMGYTTFHGLRLMRRNVPGDEPDFVVIRFGWNDHLASPVEHSFSNVRNPVLENLEDLAYDSRLYSMLRYRGIPMEAVARMGKWTPSPNPTVWVRPDDYAFNLSRMIDLARAIGARPILVDAPPAPVSPQIRANVVFIAGAGYQSVEQLLVAHARYQEITARVARGKGVPFLRTTPPAGESGAYFSAYDLPHPSAAGHERIARALRTEILQEMRSFAARR